MLSVVRGDPSGIIDGERITVSETNRPTYCGASDAARALAGASVVVMMCLQSC
jgi:hypothetical protein